MPKNNKKKQTNKSKTNKVTASEELKENEVKEVEEKDTEKEVVKQESKTAKTKKTDKKSKNDKSNKKSWFKDFKAELKKMSWPKGKELLTNTAVVVVMVIIVSAFIFLLDLAFDYLNKLEVDQVKKIQNSISSNEVVDNTIVNDETNVIEGNNTNTEVQTEGNE